MPPASMPITRLGGMAGRYTEGGERPDSRPPGVQGLPLAAQAAGAAAATSMRCEAALAAPRRRRRAAAPRDRRADHPRPGAQVGRARDRRLAAALARPLPDQRADPAGRVGRRPSARCPSSGNLFSGSNILVLGSDVRTGDSIDKSQSGPGRSDTIMLVHSAFGSVRKLSIPRDVEVDIPGHGVNKVNAAYAFGGPALTIQTLEGFLGNGLQINHVVEVDFEEFPALHRRARRRDRAQQDADLLAAVRQLLEGAPLQEGRAPPRRAARARLLARAKEQLRARRGRPRPRAPPAAGAARRSARRRSRRARSSGCPG